ncbi:MAG: type III pantothenate kinase, partial [Eubacterium sp.]|nr:type III pantothenate kinase [Eubacterium sp.]
MLLAIDIGNTNVVCALIDNGTILSTHRFATEKNTTSEYYASSFKTLLANHQPQGIIISSVVPEINEQITDVCTNITGNPPLFVSSRLHTGLHIKYDYPEKLGADLITGAVGAAARYQAPVIIVDIGTATTITVVNENKDY